MNHRQEVAHGLRALEGFRDNLRRLHRRPLVLIVDDNQDDIMLAGRTLGQNVDYVAARTVESAIQELNSKPFDIVLLDLKLENRTGLDVLSYAKASNCPAVFITFTGIDDEDPMICESLNRGAAFVVRKPLSEEHVKTLFGQIP